LESNPDVFNDFSTKIGAPVESYSFCDVYGMDEVRPFAVCSGAQSRTQL
jgi:hypothetical protein